MKALLTKTICFGLLLSVTMLSAFAQDAPRSGTADGPRPSRAGAPRDAEANPPTRVPALPSPSITHHALDVNGRSLHFTATERAYRTNDPAGVGQYDIVVTSFVLDGGDPGKRPVTFAFNGGPGVASAFLDLGLMGPWRLPIDGDAVAPSASANVVPNDDTWLDFTDLVFIDPVGTGFSRLVSQNEDVRKKVWAVEGDIESIAATIRRWIATNGRATAPKFVIGESYGGFRGPRVTRQLQSVEGIGVDGLILLSPALDMNFRPGPVDALTWAGLLPSMTATARERSGPVDRASLADVEAYAQGDYVHDLVLGTRDAAAVARVVDRVAAFIGLEKAIVAERAGRVDTTTFLRRIHGDGEDGSYYEGSTFSPDPFPGSLYSNHPDLVFDGLKAPLTSAMLDIDKRELNWLPDARYELVNQQANRQWDFGKFAPDSIGQLRAALALDRRMKVLVASGTTDLVVPYMKVQMELNQIPASLAGPDRLRMQVYPGGHMFYSRDASRKAFRDDARAMYPNP